MATLASLRTKAKNAGVPISKVRKASAEELKELISQANGKPQKASAVKAVKKSKAVKASAKKAPAAKSTTGKAKRPSTSSAKSNGKMGRNLIEGSVDFNKTKNWEPRPQSGTGRIFSALKKAKGNRDKAFEALKGDVWDFVGKVKRNGDKRTKQEAYDVLRYRIHRTLFDFVVKTGQHKISKNRIEYGTGPNAQATKKAARSAKRQTASAKRGRPAKKRGPGRPKGSKNKK